MAATNAIEQARIFAQRGNSKAAVALLSKIIQSDAKNVDAWLALADVVDEPERAEFCLQKVLELDPGNAAALGKLTKKPAASLSVGALGGAERNKPEDPPATPRVSVESNPSQVQQSGNGSGELPKPETKQSQAGPAAQVDLRRPGVMDSAQALVAQGTARFGRTDLILIGLTAFVGFVLCGLIGVAVIGGFSRQPAESPDEVVQVVFNNIIAANREDMAAYMGTIHPDAPAYNTTQATISSAFSLYDLSYEIFIPEMLEQGESDAVISFVLTTRSKGGPAFQDNVVTGEMTLKKYEGEWRIYNQTVDDVQFLN